MELLAAKHEINGNYRSLFFVQDLAVRESAHVGTGIVLKEPNPTGSRPFYSRGNLSR